MQTGGIYYYNEIDLRRITLQKFARDVVRFYGVLLSGSKCGENLNYYS